MRIRIVLGGVAGTVTLVVAIVCLGDPVVASESKAQLQRLFGAGPKETKGGDCACSSSAKASL